MGTQNSKPGASPNPRVVYSEKFAKTVQRDVRIDVPVLIDVGHGSLRYRYCRHDDGVMRSRREQPHSGSEVYGKGDYFYHARAADSFKQTGRDSIKDFQRYHVTAPPASSRNKKVFYVYGIGMDSVKDHVTRPSEAGVVHSEDYAWPEKFHVTDCNYELLFDLNCGHTDTILEDLTVTKPTENTDNTTSIAEGNTNGNTIENTDSNTVGNTDENTTNNTETQHIVVNRNCIRLFVKEESTIGDVTKLLATKLHKSVASFHIWLHNKLLGPDDIIGALHREDYSQESSSEVTVTLHLKRR